MPKNIAMMAHKRQRHDDGDGDGCCGASSSDRVLSLFGKDVIHEIGDGNASFARGGFGELSIALKSRPSPSSNSSCPSSSSTDGTTNNLNNLYSYSFAAVKTIHNAIATSGGSSGGFGRSSFSEQQQKQQLSGDVLNELLALRLLPPHPNIVPLVAVYPAVGNQRALSLAFDYCPMDLHEVLEVRRRTFRQPLAFRFVRTIFRDVFEALAHCHRNGILHRDVKPGNLLVSSKGVIQLCDFGLAKPFLSFDDDNQNNGETKQSQQPSARNNDKGLCTLYYRPPEVLLGGRSEYPSVDSWSAGVVLAELITGRPLWKGRNVIDQLSLVYGSLGTPNEEKWPSVRTLPDYGKLNFGSKPPKRWEETLPRASESPMLVDLLSNLLDLNPSERFTAKEALNHEWLRGDQHNREKVSVVVTISNEDNDHRDLRDEIIIPASLQIPLLLFPENRAMVGKLGLGIAESRRSVLSSSTKGCGICWHGPTPTPFKLGDDYP